MTLRQSTGSIASMVFMFSLVMTSAASALTTSCVGAPSASNITWTASSSGGIAPIAFLWGNGSTSSMQTIAAAPGTYSMTLQATDASSTLATTTCAATIPQPTPTISSFIASPSNIVNGQSSILSWTVGNASSTKLDNGIGTIASTSITVAPIVTTTYTLWAINPSGTTTQSVTITVNATSTNADNTIQTQIQNLLNQIAALKAQIVQLLLQRTGGTTSGTATSTAATSTVSCFKFDRDMSFGSDGDDVRELQQTLSSDSTILPPGLITGFFGHRTEEALKKFQRKFGILSIGTTTGFAGPKTRDFLQKHCESQDSEEAEADTSTATSSSENNLGAAGTSTTPAFWHWHIKHNNHDKDDKDDSHDD